MKTGRERKSKRRFKKRLNFDLASLITKHINKNLFCFGVKSKNQKRKIKRGYRKPVEVNFKVRYGRKGSK